MCLIREEAIYLRPIARTLSPLFAPPFLPCFRVACFAKLRGSHERSHREKERKRGGIEKEKLQFSRRSLFQFGPFNVSLKRSSFFFNVQPRYSLTEGVKTRVEGEVQRRFLFFFFLLSIFINGKKKGPKTDWVEWLKVLRPRASRQQLPYANTSRRRGEGYSFRSLYA